MRHKRQDGGLGFSQDALRDLHAGRAERRPPAAEPLYTAMIFGCGFKRRMPRLHRFVAGRRSGSALWRNKLCLFRKTLLGRVRASCRRSTQWHSASILGARGAFRTAATWVVGCLNAGSPSRIADQAQAIPCLCAIFCGLVPLCIPPHMLARRACLSIFAQYKGTAPGTQHLFTCGLHGSGSGADCRGHEQHGTPS